MSQPTAEDSIFEIYEFSVRQRDIIESLQNEVTRLTLKLEESEEQVRVYQELQEQYKEQLASAGNILRDANSLYAAAHGDYRGENE